VGVAKLVDKPRSAFFSLSESKENMVLPFVARSINMQ